MGLKHSAGGIQEIHVIAAISQNHRMFRVGRDLCGSASPTPLPYHPLVQLLASPALHRQHEVPPRTAAFLTTKKILARLRLNRKKRPMSAEDRDHRAGYSFSSGLILVDAATRPAQVDMEKS